MNRSRFDIVVVGAGPAGSRAAFAAADQGHAVALIERHHVVGEHILCAEGLSRSMVRGFLDIKPEWVAADLEGAIVRSPSRRELLIRYPGVGYVLERKVFDHALAVIAEKAGARLITGAEVIKADENRLTYIKKGEPKEIEFRVLIGADGAESRVGRLLGFDTHLRLKEVHVCAQYRLGGLSLDPALVQFYLDERIAPGGYAWVFPKSKTVANVGLGLSPAKTKTSPQVYLDRWVETEFPKAKKLNFLCGGVPARPLKRFASKHCLLAGDAGRFCDPLSGGGIAAAIKSGYLAGLNASRLVRGKPSRYEKDIAAELSRELTFHGRVRDTYLKFTDRDFELVFDFLTHLFAGRSISDINSREIVRQALTYNARFLKLGARVATGLFT